MRKRAIKWNRLKFELLEDRRVLAPVVWPVEQGGNGHSYEAILARVTWDQANAAAKAAGGYLATIRSVAENQFVFNLVDHAEFWSGSNGPWLGGNQTADSREPRGKWNWGTGESFAYTNWLAGQPNDAAGGQDYLHFSSLTANDRSSKWEDARGSAPTYGYVIEYGPLDDPTDQRVTWAAESGGNGHVYEAVHDQVTWDEADAAAKAAGGYLATIRSAAENQFVFGLVDNPEFWSGSNGPWLGGNQTADSREPRGKWNWGTGESFAYTNWLAGQPNDAAGGQDYLHFSSLTANDRSLKWEDVSGSTPMYGYVIEYGPLDNPTDQRVTWANGHVYEAVHDQVTWDEADAAAKAAGGYLATIRSATENQFVFGLIDNPEFWNGSNGPWLGGNQTADSREPRGKWNWGTGESFAYTNWLDGQPNDAAGGQDYLHFSSLTANDRSLKWEDASGSTPMYGYVIEYGPLDDPTDQRVTWANGHVYEAVHDQVTWDEADAAAKAAGGYLATIRSATENQFVFGLIDNPEFWNGSNGPWLGGNQTADSREPNAGWIWGTGESFAYTNWLAGQPNDAAGGQDYLHFSSLTANDRSSKWEDASGATPMYGYVIEYDSVEANPFVVTNTNDNGPGSFRQAILNANLEPGINMITFGIPGDSVHTIRPTTPFPTISDSVVINGYSQAGAVLNSVASATNAQLKIEIDGSLAGNADGITVGAPGSSVRGLAINRFSGSGIRIRSGGQRTSIQGNLVGTNVDGTQALPNGLGIILENAQDVQIGGTDVSQINLISGNTVAGIDIVGNNASNNQVYRNLIGTTAAGNPSLPNQQYGIRIQSGAAFTTIGGLAPGQASVIYSDTDPTDSAVRIESGIGNTVRGNRFLDSPGMAIDLGSAGPTGDDVDDFDYGPNNLQNFPLLRRAIASNQLGGGIQILYSLPSSGQAAAYPIDIDFYLAGNSYIEGEQYVSTLRHQEPTTGLVLRTLNVDIPPGARIAAIATDAAGNTSEFSPVIVVQRAIPPDGNEPRNNSRDQAEMVNGLCRSQTVSRPGSIHNLTDEDFVGISIDCPGTLIVTSNFFNAFGDLDVAIYDSAMAAEPIAVSAGKGDIERIVVPVVADPNNVQTYFVKVFGYQGDVNPNYNLTIEYRIDDADGDGLLDEWERMQGIDVDRDGRVDVALSGADVNQKDLFVEVDFMLDRGPVSLPAANDVRRLYPGSPDGTTLPSGLQPTTTSLDMVVDAFGRAPVLNAIGQAGIRLHLLVDRTDVIPAEPFQSWGDFLTVRDAHFGTPAERQHQRWNQIKTAKRNVYRYALFADRLEDSERFGRSSINSNDFVITLGSNIGAGAGLPYEQAGVFMHELGHSLGLSHGGGDEINFKPNYISVMNYLWVFPRPETAGWRLDYSRFKLPSINRRSLDETQGIACDNPDTRYRDYYTDMRVPIGPVGFRETGRYHQVAVFGCSVDWNHDGDAVDGGNLQDPLAIDVARLAWDADGDGFVTQRDDFAGGAPQDVLVGHDDWVNLRFQFTYSDVIKFGDVYDLVELGREDPERGNPSLPFDEDKLDVGDADNDSIEHPFIFGFPPTDDLFDFLFGQVVADRPNGYRLSISSSQGRVDDDWFKLVLPFAGRLEITFEAEDTDRDLGLGLQVINAQRNLLATEISKENDVRTISLDVGFDQAGNCNFIDDIAKCDGMFLHAYGESDPDTTEIGLYKLGLQLDISPDAGNIDRLVDAIRRSGGRLLSFANPYDLDRNGILDANDLIDLVHEKLKTAFGDANLDGLFDSGDLIQVFQRGEYEDSVTGNSTWVDGDWNGDHEFDSGDMIKAFQDGKYEAAPPAAVVAWATDEPEQSLDGSAVDELFELGLIVFDSVAPANSNRNSQDPQSNRWNRKSFEDHGVTSRPRLDQFDYLAKPLERRRSENATNQAQDSSLLGFAASGNERKSILSVF